ncbi:MAG: Rad3-related DNA helicase, partial [Alteromonadaceae bacterium]
MNVDEFLKLLDDPKVREKIKLLVSYTGSIENLPEESREVTESHKKNIPLELENQDLKKVNEDLKKDNGKMIERIKQLLAQMLGKDKELSGNNSRVQSLDLQVSNLKLLVDSKESKVESLAKETKNSKELLAISDKKLNWYREHFSEDVKVQGIYSNLSEATKGSLSGIFKSTTISGLIACGIQEKNIGNLWEYAKNEVVNGINPDILTITKLFEILFARFTLAFPMYEIQSVSSGDDFDT